MASLRRFPGNPILSPLHSHTWEQEATFNGCPIIEGNTCHIVYRAQSSARNIAGKTLELSTIGHAASIDRITFTERKQLIVPDHDWEKFGCEDPRVTKIGDEYHIFYTALADWPPTPAGITVALATTKNFKTIDHKYQITPFNAKAMTLFPGLINGKYCALLTINPDKPPSSMCIAYFDKLSDIWNANYWKQWRRSVGRYTIPLLRTTHDHVEVGAPPIKTKHGWLFIYCYIKSYLTSHKFFTIEAALLDGDDPTKVIGRTQEPLLYPETDYEVEGKIPNIVFPSGALIVNNNLGVYYGGADTRICLATCPLDVLFQELLRGRASS